ncbi:MAG: hypothetical protein CYG60_08510 [Actinobacteria bacterium]|nr:MAG: hypothetical protein CYG60_08510 [Actinomycetota bacterium]
MSTQRGASFLALGFPPTSASPRVACIVRNLMAEKPERVALYLRVSSEEQRERETISLQRLFLQQYKDLYGLEVSAVYEDDGISGTLPLKERPEGARMLRDAAEGLFSAVVVKRLDRLGRRLLVIVEAHDALAKAEVALKSATEPIDTSSPSGRLIFQMLASFAEYDRESIKERTQAGLHRAFRDGKHMGRVPYGYRVEEGILVVVEEEAEVVREIVRNIAEGSTLYREAKRLNALGLPSPGYRSVGEERKPGRSWSATTIAGIIHQGAYSGVHEVRASSGPIEREVPAILPEGLQGKARKRLERNSRYRDREGDRRYLLQGLVKCAECGYGCIGHSAKARGKRYHYYSCPQGRTEKVRQTEPHRAPFVNAEWLEGLVWDDVRRFLSDPGDALRRARELEESVVTEASEDTLRDRRKELAEGISSVARERDRYVRLYARGHLEESSLESYLEELEERGERLRDLLAAVDSDLSSQESARKAAESAEAWLDALRGKLALLEKEEVEDPFGAKRALVNLLVERVEVGGREKNSAPSVSVEYRFAPPE